MSVSEPRTAVDVVPYAARQGWSGETTYEICWEDPRDIVRVEVEFERGAPQSQEGVQLEYWQNAWPGVRIPKGAVIGAGNSGWLANDDWTNGRWQRADAESRLDGKCWSCTFRALNLQEFSEETYPVTFRRTLRLRLRLAQGGAEIVQVRAFTDSTWRETDVAIEWVSPTGAAIRRDGHLEAYNGKILELRPLAKGTCLAGPTSWRSTVEGAATSGILARLRYAGNDDPNSYDAAIITVRAEGASFSFSMADLLQGEPIYVRDLGMLVSRAVDGVRLSTHMTRWSAHHGTTVYQRVAGLPEQSWEQAWAAMPAKGRFYFVLGCEGSRQKFGIEPNGELFLREAFIRRVPGKDTERLGGSWRELRFGFGLPEVEPADRSLLDGELPIIRSTWTEGELAYEQEVFATWLWRHDAAERPDGDDPVVAMVQLRIANLSNLDARLIRLPLTASVDRVRLASLSAQGNQVRSADEAASRLGYLIEGTGSLKQVGDGLCYELKLPARSSTTVHCKVPFINADQPHEIARLAKLSYAEERAQVTDFWRRRLDQGAQIETPSATLNAFYRTHLMHMLVINDREPGSHRTVARCGGFDYGSFPDEGCMVISDLDRRGYTLEAERCLDLYLEYQGTVPLPGNYASSEGVFYGSGGYEVAGYNRNQGWVMWCLAEHYRYTRDQAWLERAAPALVSACDWITRERQATRHLDAQGQRPIQFGFLPQGSLEDVTDYWTWLSTNAYAYLGMRSVAEVLTEIQHPEAQRLMGEAQLYYDDLRAGFFEAAVRSPVVRLRDGTWVPHFPARQERRGRDDETFLRRRKLPGQGFGPLPGPVGMVEILSAENGEGPPRPMDEPGNLGGHPSRGV